MPPVPDAHDVDVVVDPYRCAIRGLEPLAEGISVPAGHDRGRVRSARGELDRPRDADPHPFDLLNASLVQQLASELVQPAQDMLRSAGDVYRPGTMGDD